jgi:hypothetical protein
VTVSSAIHREVRGLTAAVGRPVLFIVKGLQAYRGDWGSGGTTIGPDDELRVKDEVDRIGAHHKDLALCINAFGGSSASAFNVARLLRSRFRQIVVYVPHVAASAATLLSLGADRVVMSQCAYMTMVDPMLRLGPFLVQATQIIHAGALPGANMPAEHRLVAASSLAMIEEQLTSVLRDAGYGEAVQSSVKRRLLLSRGSHDAPISRGELREVGVRVAPDRECDSSDGLRRAERLLRLLVESTERGFVAASSPKERRRLPS